MNRQDIIRMAREAGLHAPEGRTYILSPTIHPDDDLSEYLERFAALVASAEREACIDLVAMYGGPVDLEAAIRAKGDKHDAIN